VNPPRATQDYGLSPLTFEEAARVLGTTATEFREWLEAKVRTTSQQRTNWKRRGEQAGLSVDVIPEIYIRLYLAMRLGHIVPLKTQLPALPAVAGSLRPRRPRAVGRARRRG